MLDGEVLAGALVQISLFPGMSQVERDTIQLVALLLAEMEQTGAGTTALDGCVERMVTEFTEAIKSITQTAVTEVKLASSTLTETSTQFTATATSYWDALTSKGPVLNPIAAAATLDVRVRAREGIKSRQLLINARN